MKRRESLGPIVVQLFSKTNEPLQSHWSTDGRKPPRAPVLPSGRGGRVKSKRKRPDTRWISKCTLLLLVCLVLFALYRRAALAGGDSAGTRTPAAAETPWQSPLGVQVPSRRAVSSFAASTESNKELDDSRTIAAIAMVVPRGAITIRGEMSSGTNWIRQLINRNTNLLWILKPGLDMDGKYGWKHGYWNKRTLDDGDRLVVVVRDVFTWLPRMYAHHGHGKSFSDFIRAPVSPSSRKCANFKECPYEHAANLVRLRTSKYREWLRFGHLIRYEDVLRDPVSTLLPLGILVRDKVSGYTKYGKVSSKMFISEVDHIWSKIDRDFVLSELDLSLERRMGYTPSGGSVHPKAVPKTPNNVIAESYVPTAPRKSSMSLMVAIPIHGRLGYVEVCAAALRDSAHGFRNVHVFHDGHTDFKSVLPPGVKYDSHVLSSAKQIDEHSRGILRVFLASEHTHVLFLDSDLVVAREWYAGLGVLLNTHDDIVSLYNSASHDAHACTGGICRKKTIGNAGAVMSRAFAREQLKFTGLFDWGYSKRRGSKGFVVPEVSLVEHIGHFGKWNKHCDHSKVEHAYRFDESSLSRFVRARVHAYIVDCEKPDTPRTCSPYASSKCKCLRGYTGTDCGVPPGVKSARRRRPRRIIQAFPINHELDLLEIRMRETRAETALYVILESNYSAFGVPKPMHVAERRPGLLKRHDVLYIPLTHFPPGGREDGWVADRYLRTYLSKTALQSPRIGAFSDDDLFLILDADEIPRAEVLWFLRHYDVALPVGFAFTHYVFAAFWKGGATRLSVATTLKAFRGVHGGDAIRLRRKSKPRTWIPDAGWHFSWCQTPEGIRTKLVDAQNGDFPRWGSIPEKLDLEYLRGLVVKGEYFDGKRPWTANPKPDLPDCVKREPRWRYLWDRAWWETAPTRKIVVIFACAKSTKKHQQHDSLIEVFAPSIKRTLTRRERQTYDIRIYIGLDEGERHWDTTLTNLSGIPVCWFTFKKTETHRIPFNPLAQRVYDDGAEWFIRVNDDTEFTSNGWLTLGIAELTRLNHVGSVSPVDSFNTRIFTHDMTHRTHMNIFKTYYSPVFKNWYIDDWITRIYEPDRSIQIRDWTVTHHVAKYGSRYRASMDQHPRLKDEIRKGKRIVWAYEHKHHLPRVSVQMTHDAIVARKSDLNENNKIGTFVWDDPARNNELIRDDTVDIQSSPKKKWSVDTKLTPYLLRNKRKAYRNIGAGTLNEMISMGHDILRSRVAMFSDVWCDVEGRILGYKVPLVRNGGCISTGTMKDTGQSKQYNRVITIAGRWGGAHWHFPMEALVAFSAITDKMMTGDTYIHISSKNAYVIEWIQRILGIQQERVITGTIRADMLIVPEMGKCGMPSPMQLRWLSQRMKIPPSIPRSNHAVLIKRTKSRPLPTFESIKQHLETNGFSVSIHDDSHMSTLSDQWKQFGSASLVLAPHGAGLINILALNDGVPVIEFMRPSDDINLCYGRIAYILGFPYAAIPYSSSMKHVQETIQRLTRPVSFTITVLTKSRRKSVQRLLTSLKRANYDGDRIALDIQVDSPTTFNAKEVEWPFGPLSVHVATRPLGLRGNWLRTPARRGIILEDDIEVSPRWYIWLKAAWAAYGHRTDLAGISLQRQTLIPKQPHKYREIVNDHQPFLYALVGSIGFSPHPDRWREFQRTKQADISTPGLVTWDWYKQVRHGSMWTQEFIRFCRDRSLYTLYVNLPGSETLAAHWREKGEHFPGGQGRDFRPARSVVPRFPKKPHTYGWDGRKIAVISTRIVKLGTSYGSWSYDATNINADSIVYSVGIGEDMSWDEAIATKHGLHVWGFDPTPRAVTFVKNRKPISWFHFTAEGLYTQKGTAVFTKPKNPDHVSMRIGTHAGLGKMVSVSVNTLENWMNTFGHSHIDILKLDIEGAEYDVLEDWIERKWFPFTQLLVEFHQRFGIQKSRHERMRANLRNNGFQQITVPGDTSLWIRRGHRHHLNSMSVKNYSNTTGIQAEFEEFMKVYNTRPWKINKGGTSITHQYALWTTVRRLKPLHIIESGVWNGGGSWILRQACPTCQMTFMDPNPRKPALYFDTYKDSVYLTGTNFIDFAKHDWSDINTERTFILFDDHQSGVRRTKEAYDLGFRHISFDDNYPPGYGDNYSLKKMYANWPGPYQDNFGKTRLINPPNVRMLIEKYVEFPPLFDICVTHRLSISNCRDITPSPLLKTREIDPNYTWIAIVTLRKRPVVILQFLNAGYVELTKSWICNVRRFPGVLERTLFIVTDQTAYEALKPLGVRVRHIPYQTPVDMKYGQYAYYDYMRFRTTIILEFLNKGTTIWLTESDAVWLKDPTKRILAADGDVVTVSDTHPAKCVQGGFQLLRPTSLVKQAWNTLSRKQAAVMSKFKRGSNMGEAGNEQVMMTTIYSRIPGLKVSWISRDVIAPGGWYNKPVGSPSVILNNWIVGNRAKIARAKKFGHWYIHGESAATQTCETFPRHTQPHHAVSPHSMR